MLKAGPFVNRIKLITLSASRPSFPGKRRVSGPEGIQRYGGEGLKVKLPICVAATAHKCYHI